MTLEVHIIVHFIFFFAMTMNLLWISSTSPILHNTSDLNVSLLYRKDSLTAIPYLLRTSPWNLPELSPSLFVWAPYHLLYILTYFLCLCMDFCSWSVKKTWISFCLLVSSAMKYSVSVFKITTLPLFETIPIMLNFGKFPVDHCLPRDIPRSFQVKARV